MENDSISDNSSGSVESATQPSQQQESPSQERTFTQDEVNRIVAANKAKVAERYEKRIEEPTAPSQAYRPPPQQAQPHQQSNGENFSPDLVDKRFNELVNERRLAWEQEQQRIAELEAQKAVEKLQEDWKSKTANNDEYEDYQEVVKGFDPEVNQALALVLSMDDETSTLAYEFAKRKSDAWRLNSMLESAIERNDQNLIDKVKGEIEQVKAQLIQRREAQKNYQKTNAPLSHLKPTNYGSGDGKLSYQDRKRIYTN